MSRVEACEQLDVSYGPTSPISEPLAASEHVGSSDESEGLGSEALLTEKVVGLPEARAQGSFRAASISERVGKVERQVVDLTAAVERLFEVVEGRAGLRQPGDFHGQGDVQALLQDPFVDGLIKRLKEAEETLSQYVESAEKDRHVLSKLIDVLGTSTGMGTHLCDMPCPEEVAEGGDEDELRCGPHRSLVEVIDVRATIQEGRTDEENEGYDSVREQEPHEPHCLEDEREECAETGEEREDDGWPQRGPAEELHADAEEHLESLVDEGTEESGLTAKLPQAKAPADPVWDDVGSGAAACESGFGAFEMWDASGNLVSTSRQPERLKLLRSLPLSCSSSSTLPRCQREANDVSSPKWPEASDGLSLDIEGTAVKTTDLDSMRDMSGHVAECCRGLRDVDNRLRKFTKALNQRLDMQRQELLLTRNRVDILFKDKPAQLPCSQANWGPSMSSLASGTCERSPSAPPPGKKSPASARFSLHEVGSRWMSGDPLLPLREMLNLKCCQQESSASAQVVVWEDF